MLLFVRALFQKRDEILAQFVVVRMFHHFFAIARPREGDFEDVADFGFGTVGHHDDAVGEKERFIDVVRDHERGLFVFAPKFDQRLLQFVAGERVEHAKGLVQKEHLRRQSEGASYANPLSHAL